MTNIHLSHNAIVGATGSGKSYTARGGSFNAGFAALRNNGLLYEHTNGSFRLATTLPGESA